MRSKHKIDSTFLDNLIQRWEHELVEFKGEKMGNRSIGEYFSALANEANLSERDNAWLVLGVDDSTRTVVGVDRELSSKDISEQKLSIKTLTSQSFREIYSILYNDKKVILYEIPAAPRGEPVSCNGHYYSREGESVVALGSDKYDRIRSQVRHADWSAKIVNGTSIEDLDKNAIKVAREKFAETHAENIPSDEIEDWTDDSFLHKAKVAKNGQITRAGLLLLGKSESVLHLSPFPAQITWKLEDEKQDYRHFNPPFLLTTTQIYGRIHNIKIRHLPRGELLAIDVWKYDQRVILEALHNCIAHQDYTLNIRTIVTEYDDRLIFKNGGNFFEEHPDLYALKEHSPSRYRNQLLADMMVEFRMTDRIGYGINSIYASQRRRFMPLPDYDLDEPEHVKLTIYGQSTDSAYSQLLMSKTDLSPEDVFYLDRIQKKHHVDSDIIRQLRKKKLIEGRKPNIHVSAKLADVTGKRADYIRTRAKDNEHYITMITDLIEQFGKASRSEINDLLMDKISDALSDEQKYRKISSLLSRMRREKIIVNVGNNRNPVWKIFGTYQSEG